MESKGIDRSARGVNRVLVKLESSIENGNYYEAHQMYRTLYFRYIAQEKYDECLELLLSGSLKLVEKSENTSSADLALLIVDVLEKRPEAYNYVPWIQNLCEIIAFLAPSCLERETLINRTIEWSGKITNNKFGYPAARERIGSVFWAEHKYEQARQHLIFAKNGNLFGKILKEISISKGFKSEADMFIAQAVFQLLCIDDVVNADKAFVTYTTNHPQISTNNVPFKEPLLNFLFFLLRCIERKDAKAFRKILDLYAKALEKDESYKTYINKISEKYFGLQLQSTDNRGNFMNGIFGDLFSRLISGFDDEEETTSATNDVQMHDNTINRNNAELD